MHKSTHSAPGFSVLSTLRRLVLIAEEDRGFASISELVEAHACTQAYTQTTILSRELDPTNPSADRLQREAYRDTIIVYTFRRYILSMILCTNVDIDWDKISTETVQADGNISEEGSERKRINMIS